MNQVKANTQSCLTKQKGGTKRMHIMCKACVCLNLTISWFLGLAFSSAFVAFSNSTSLHIRQKHISCRVRNGQNKCIRQLKCSSRDSKKKITNRENGFSKLGHWNCNLEVPQLAHLYLMVPDSTTTTKHSTIPVFV